MSSVKIAGDTSGLITLAAPAAAGTNTITMPASTGTMALTSNITTAVPSQTGNSGKYLTTNGSATSWGTVASGGITLITTVNTTSGTSISTGTIDLTGYKQLTMICYSIGSSASTGGQFRYTPNGGSTMIFYGTPTGTSSQAQYTMYTHDLASGIGRSSSLTAKARNETLLAPGGPTGMAINTSLSTSTTSIVFDMDGGETFDIGQITIYGLS